MYQDIYTANIFLFSFYKLIVKGSDDGILHVWLRPQVRRWETSVQLDPLKKIRGLWHRLALSTGPNWIGASPLFSWGQKQLQFQKCCVLWQYWIMDRAHKLGNTNAVSFQGLKHVRHILSNKWTTICYTWWFLLLHYHNNEYFSKNRVILCENMEVADSIKTT
jgi:hypothetical protein